ncbi:prion-inhibition and propagation-domain-containing protein [Pyrenochaeta sp. MPI-SDFR-AT-0127]|nr:prion-inhibition and propagation-domain-containing protein [Pyrenochaeta sp. MPI-SDFR-AT-0127]
MDVAGLALGGSSLAIQLFSACTSLYQTVQSAIGQDADFAGLVCKLEIEEQRFHLWGNAAKLQSGVDVSSRHLPTVLRTLECIERLLSGRQKLVNRNELSQSINGHAHLPEGVGEAAESVIRRLRWTISDKRHFETLVADLKGYNDSLNALLYEGQRLSVIESFKELSIKVLGTDNPEKLNILRQSTWNTYEDICSTAALKCLALQMEHALTKSNSKEPPKSLEVIPQLTLPWDRQPLMRRETSLIQRHPHLVEWKELPSEGSDKRDRVLRRLQYLVAFLSQAPKPQNLRVLALVGTAFSPDSKKLGLVSSFPEDTGSSDPTSLQDYLTSSSRQHRLPTLNDRITLALRLANTLLVLHTSGWMHKAIAPHNILFFHSDDGNEDSDPRSGILQSPFLAGFEYSREDGSMDQEGAYSETVTTGSDMEFYRHPSSRGSQRSKFRKQYDIYSLGFVLLDIALWKSSASLCRNTSPKEIRSVVVDRYLRGDIAYRAGSVYQEVVETCLMGNFGERGSEKNWLETQFLRRVVQRLETCKV